VLSRPTWVEVSCKPRLVKGH